MMKGCLRPHFCAVCGGECWCLGANGGACAPTSTGALSMLGVGEGEWMFTVSSAPVSSREARNFGLLDRPSDFKNADLDRAYFVWSKLSIFRS